MSQLEYDPVFLHARREAVVVMCLFALALTWSIGSYYFLGYTQATAKPEENQSIQRSAKLSEDPRFTPREVSTVLGIPTWVFTGIVLPWLAIDLVAYWFCFHYMADDDLGEAPEDTPVESTPS